MVAVVLVTVGTAALIRIVTFGAGEGVISTPAAVSLAVIVAVPATVPVCTPTPFNGTSEPAGMVRVAVRPPVANCTVGSSAPESGAKVRVRATVTSTGYTLSIPIVSVDCDPGLEVGGSPLRASVGAGGSVTLTVTCWLRLLPALSFTVSVNVVEPGVVGVPESPPPEDTLRPGGN